MERCLATPFALDSTAAHFRFASQSYTPEYCVRLGDLLLSILQEKKKKQLEQSLPKKLDKLTPCLHSLRGVRAGRMQWALLPPRVGHCQLLEHEQHT